MKSRLMWYLVSLSPPVNGTLVPLPAVHSKPWPMVTGTPASVRPCDTNTRSRFPNFPYRAVAPLAVTKVIVMPPLLGPLAHVVA